MLALASENGSADCAVDWTYEAHSPKVARQQGGYRLAYLLNHNRAVAGNLTAGLQSGPTQVTAIVSIEVRTRH